MAGRHSFAKLRDAMPPEAQARVAARAASLREEMDLAELRRARRLSQEELGQTLKVGQAAIAKVERRADMYLSTLRRFVEAMGGELELVARFPDHQVKIKSLGGLSEDAGQNI